MKSMVTMLGLQTPQQHVQQQKISSPDTVLPYRAFISMLFLLTGVVPVLHSDVGLQVRQQHVHQQKI